MALGVSVFPAPASITINGRTVTIDLENQSLTEIAAMINAQTPNTASVETVTNNPGIDSYRLKISGTVAATADPSSQPILDMLGITRGTSGAVQHTVSTANTLLDGASATATGATLLSTLT